MKAKPADACRHVEVTEIGTQAKSCVYEAKQSGEMARGDATKHALPNVSGSSARAAQMPDLFLIILWSFLLALIFVCSRLE